MTTELWTKLKTLTFPGLLNLQHRCWNMMTINVELACRVGFLQPNCHMLVLMLNLTQHFLILFLPFILRMFFGNAPEVLTVYHRLMGRHINFRKRAEVPFTN